VCGEDIEIDCAVCGCASKNLKILGKSVVQKIQYAGLSYEGISVRTHIYSVHSQKTPGSIVESLRDLDTFLMQGKCIIYREILIHFVIGKLVRVLRDFKHCAIPQLRELRPDRKEETGNAAGLSSPNTRSAGKEPGRRPGTRLSTEYTIGGSKPFREGRAPTPPPPPPFLLQGGTFAEDTSVDHRHLYRSTG
jgi:hypothetical protein